MRQMRFFRIAYGATSTEQFLGRSEITSILRDFTKGSRLVLNWHPLEDVTRSEVQLVFLAIQCAEQALPYGGHVEIERLIPRVLVIDVFWPNLWSRLT